ncbi:hypothetical protein GOP47_0017157 [Adiantum capillus-veneris]|uniref:Pentatricopeptide repeat-containing protein n=1 Tax=Adiantum capillus-veneris TaxID=13818 RepID=A0A9D4ZCC9_ADICA|nr:hypothetical protein GOP47_0017157 [Adiantum capillus-veneris]
MAAWQVSSNSFKDQSWFQEELQIVELKVAEYIIADKEQNQVSEGEKEQEVTYNKQHLVKQNACDPIILVSLLKDCVKQNNFHKGSRLHAEAVKWSLLECNTYVGNTLINFYAKCGMLAKAQQVFDQLTVKDVVSWNTLITGYAHYEHDEAALECFECMLREGLSPSAVTFTCVLKACTSLGDAIKGEEIHAAIIRERTFEKNVFVGSTLINMYAKSGALEKAQDVFDGLPTRNLVSWNALIAGYTQQGRVEGALNHFYRMQEEGISPDAVTFVCSLKACGSTGTIQKGKILHAQVFRLGLLETNILAGNSLIDMYAKCGLLEEAQQVFDKLPVVDVISWTSLIAGYAHHLHDEDAVNCYERMRSEGFTPDDVTFVCILKACGSIGDSCQGQEIHCEVVKEGWLENNISLGNALVNLYANCGMIIEAQEVFDHMRARNVVSWNILLGGYSQLGEDEIVFRSFKELIREAIEPDLITFSTVLNTCSQRGLLDKAEAYFESMNLHHHIDPSLEHRACMVDLFCRAGHLEKALAVIEDMPVLASSTVWFSVVFACQNLEAMRLVQTIFQHAALSDISAYICVSNVYAASE